MRAGIGLALLLACAATTLNGQAAGPASAAAPAPAAAGPAARPSPLSDSTPLPPGVSIAAAAEPDTVTVGDRFVVGLALRVSPGTRVALEIGRDSADRWRVLAAPAVQARDSARGEYRVIARMVAWLPGPQPAVPARLTLTGADGRAIPIPLRLTLPGVRAVLPADSARWVVKPPHDVWGPPQDAKRLAWLGTIALLLLALLAALVVWLLRRRRRSAIPRTARERALHQLDQAARSGLIEAGNWKELYTRVSAALREYATALRGEWSRDLTSAELLAAMRERLAGEDTAVAPLAEVLRICDLAKFARHGRTPDAARADLDTARGWVRDFSPAGPEDPEDAAAAAAPAAAGAGR